MDNILYIVITLAILLLLPFEGLGLSRLLVSLFYFKWIIIWGILTLKYFDKNIIIDSKMIFGNQLEEQS